MEFYIDEMRLPVPVKEIQVKTGADINTVNILKKGEIGLPGGKKLDNISFSSFFPQQYRSFCQYSGFPSPDEFINHIETAQKEGKPIRFIITGTDINKLFLVENFEKTYKIHGRGDVDFSISLVEYIEIEIPKIADATKSTDKNNKRPSKKDNSSKKDREHIVKKGDTLWGLSKKYYGNGSDYMKIFNANKDKIKNPNLIIDGWKLVIP